MKGPVAISRTSPSSSRTGRAHASYTGLSSRTRSSREPAPGGVVLIIVSAETIRGLVPRRYSLMSGRCAPIAGSAAASASDRPSAAPRCWLMSASTATTGASLAARWRMKSEDSVVLPLPPFPTKAIFMFT